MAKRAAAIEVNLPALEAAGDTRLLPDGHHDAIEFRGLDLGGQRAPRSTFMDCGLFDCQLDGTALPQARLTDCVLDGVQAGDLDLADSRWRDVVVGDCRFGALATNGGVLQRVRFTGGKIDFLNARGAELSDVRFEGCRLGEIEFGDARLRRVSFVDCEIDRLELTGAELAEVDLSRARLVMIGGIGHLSGAVISEQQLGDLAAAFADHLGVTIVPTP